MAKLLFLLLLISSVCFGQTTFDKAKSLYENKQLKEAESSLKLISKTHPDYAAAQYYLGRINCDRKNYEAAVDNFEEATKVNLKIADYFNWLGNTYATIAQNANPFKQGLLAPKIKKAWETTVTLDPKNIVTRASLIQFYLQAPGIMGGSIEKAKQTAKQISDLNPAEGHQQFAIIYLYEKKIPEAEREYLAMVKDEPSFYPQLINFYIDQKNYSKAFDFLTDENKKKPEDFGIIYQIGKTAALSGQKLDQGEECLKKYLTYTPQKSEPAHSGANMRLGQIKERAGDKLQAKKYFAAALKDDPNLKEAKEGLERCSK